MKRIFLFLLIAACMVLLAPPKVGAEEIYTTDKLITVDTTKQMVYAWEGGRVVFQAPAATGLPKSPTVKGKFKIYLKHEVQAYMRGVSPYIGRYVFKDVPYVMYFHQSYGLHGAPWHNSFGVRRSNGCVNLPVYAAKWLFEFAPIGTTVMVF